MRIEQISEELYKTFMENHTLVNIWQTTMMGDMQEAQGKEVMYLGIYEDTGVLTGATSMILEPSHFGKLHARSPRGAGAGLYRGSGWRYDYSYPGLSETPECNVLESGSLRSLSEAYIGW